MKDQTRNHPAGLVSAANLVTAARVVLAPLFFWLMYRGRGTALGQPGKALPAMAVFTAAALSDYLDGFLARRSGPSSLGAFLDPLADKLLVGAALVALVAWRGFPLWAAVAIGAREVAVSLLRSAALRRGRSMPASRLGKLKTASQIPMVLVWILPRAGWLAAAQDASLALALALTAVSGLAYFRRTSELLAPPDPA